MEIDSLLETGVPLRRPGLLDHLSSTAGGTLSLASLLVLTALFWSYVTVVDVAYAHSMEVNAYSVTHHMLFAPWTVRVLQHLILFPLVVACYWASMRLGWSGRLHVALQIILWVTFCALGFPAMEAAGDVHAHLVGSGVNTIYTDSSGEVFSALWVASFLAHMPTYGFGLALITGFSLYQRIRDAEVRTSKLERDWSTARLATLRMQLSPHTLFNLLHTIRGQINWEPEAARSMVVQLADLLRRLLNAGAKDFSLLSEELHFVSLYLDLQRQRFADRLSISMEDSTKQPRLWIPSLILQPLVENAVVHGLAGHSGTVKISLAVIASPEVLTIELINTTAPGMAPGTEGVGLSNVRERIAVQFGVKASLDVGPIDQSTWRSRLRLPAIPDRAGGP